MALRLRKPEAALMKRVDRTSRIKRLLGEVQIAMIEETGTKGISFGSTSEDLALAVVERLDPRREVPELLRLAAWQQLTYELRRVDPELPRPRWRRS